MTHQQRQQEVKRGRRLTRSSDSTEDSDTTSDTLLLFDRTFGILFRRVVLHNKVERIRKRFDRFIEFC